MDHEIICKECGDKFTDFTLCASRSNRKFCDRCLSARKARRAREIRRRKKDGKVKAVVDTLRRWLS